LLIVIHLFFAGVT